MNKRKARRTWHRTRNPIYKIINQISNYVDRLIQDYNRKYTQLLFVSIETIQMIKIIKTKLHRQLVESTGS